MLELEIQKMFEQEETDQENAGEEVLQDAEAAEKEVRHRTHSYIRNRNKQHSKTWQKNKIKKDYRKEYRKKRKADATTGAGRKMQRVFRAKIQSQKIPVSNSATLISVCTVCLLLFLVIVSLSSCSVMFLGSISNLTYRAYQSDPLEIDRADLIFSEMEADLEAEIKRTETDSPGYDDYQYDIDPIGHDPMQLAAYLHAKYESYTADGIMQDLRDIFNGVYQLEIEQFVESGMRYVHAKDAEGNLMYDVNGFAIFVEEPYEEWILKVILTTTFIEELVAELSEEQREAYALFMESKGGLQQLASPVKAAWHVYVSSQYGYRIHPLTGEKELHRGVDIALSEGTLVYAAHSGRVEVAEYSDSYGNYVVITDQDGCTTKYAHMSSLQVTEGQEVMVGTQIGTVGNTGISTGSHLHMEVIFDGDFYNPLFYVDE